MVRGGGKGGGRESVEENAAVDLEVVDRKFAEGLGVAAEGLAAGHGAPASAAHRRPPEILETERMTGSGTTGGLGTPGARGVSVGHVHLLPGVAGAAVAAEDGVG